MSALHPPRALRLLSLLSALCLLPGSRQLSIKEFVVPKAVEVGKDVELRCQYELDGNETEDTIVKWWWTPDSGAGDVPVQLYQRIAGREAQAIQHNNTTQIEIKGNDSIVLLDVKPMDSGTYGCEVTNFIDKELRKHETLTVFSMGTGPAINYTLINSEVEEEEDNLLLECEAEDVAPFPALTIIFKGEKIETSTIVEENENGLYKIFVNGTVSIGDVNEEEIRCELSYDSIKHPPYVDVKQYKPPGRDAPPSTEPPEDATEPDPTHDSLQNPSDEGVGLHCSWALLMLAAVVTHLQATL